MGSASSSSDRPPSSPPPPPIHRSLFPSVTEIWTPGDTASVPERIVELSVFDAHLVAKPLASYDAAFNPSMYPTPTADGCAGIPTPPENPKDPYLFPTLTKYERERITSLWYYTRDIEHDKPFLAHLQHTIDLVRELTQCDCVIMGLLDLDYYTRLVTSNVPLAVTPRREATCSHTILQEPGSVFMVSDMKQDWRFGTSPHAEAGLGFYAGTQLRCQLPGASSDIIFGSLCVASWDPQPPLSERQQRALKRFSDILTYSIVERARTIRSSDRHKMSTALAQVTEQADAHNVVELVLGALRSTYLGAIVSLQHRPNGTIQLAENQDVPYESFQHFLWEDTAAIDEHILRSNHIPPQRTRKSLRAIAVRRSTEAGVYLVVQTSDMKNVFDDIDASFVQSCALLMCNILQAHKLNEAIAAKSLFLRGAAHQLRTPIHAILSTCELLLDQVRAQTKQWGVSTMLDPSNITLDSTSSLSNAATTLNFIDTSGRNLLATINNFLNFDRLSSVRPVRQLIGLAALEQEVLDQIASLASERGLDLVCDNQLPPDVHLLDGDLDLLKQCLGAVLQNALDFTSQGTIIFRTSLIVETESTALLFDVIDSGSGIADKDQERIFLPFEKGDPLSTRPGLGLSVASSIVSALDGTITLVASSPHGSHFRVWFDQPSLACKADHVFNHLRHSQMPRTFHMLEGVDTPHTKRLAYAARQFECIGFTSGAAETAELVLMDRGNLVNGMEDVLKTISKQQHVLTLCRKDADATVVSALAVSLEMGSRVATCAEPFCRGRLTQSVKALLDGWEAFHPQSRLAALQKSPSGRELFVLRQSKRTWATLNVLIVDDNRTNLDILCMNAKRRRFPYITAMDGAQAVEAFEKSQAGESDSSLANSVSLILMDLQMPHMDGVEATRRIRMYERGNHLPPSLIYMVTGQSSDDDKQRSVEAGADGFFVKPLSLRTLNDLVYLHFPK